MSLHICVAEAMDPDEFLGVTRPNRVLKNISKDQDLFHAIREFGTLLTQGQGGCKSEITFTSALPLGKERTKFSNCIKKVLVLVDIYQDSIRARSKRLPEISLSLRNCRPASQLW